MVRTEVLRLLLIGAPVLFWPSLASAQATRSGPAAAGALPQSPSATQPYRCRGTVYCREMWSKALSKFRPAWRRHEAHGPGKPASIGHVCQGRCHMGREKIDQSQGFVTQGLAMPAHQTDLPLQRRLYNSVHLQLP